MKSRHKRHLPPLYHEVEVVNVSPVRHGDAEPGVLLRSATAFGEILDEPYLKVVRLFDVVGIPDPEPVDEAIRIIDGHSPSAGKTPEEVFKEAAR